MREFEKDGEIKVNGEDVFVTAFNPVFFMDEIEGVKVVVRVGESEVDLCQGDLPADQASAVDAWLEETYNPWALAKTQEERDSDAAEAAFGRFQEGYY